MGKIDIRQILEKLSLRLQKKKERRASKVGLWGSQTMKYKKIR